MSVSVSATVSARVIQTPSQSPALHICILDGRDCCHQQPELLFLVTGECASGDERCIIKARSFGFWSTTLASRWTTAPVDGFIIRGTTAPTTAPNNGVFWGRWTTSTISNTSSSTTSTIGNSFTTACTISSTSTAAVSAQTRCSTASCSGDANDRYAPNRRASRGRCARALSLSRLKLRSASK